MKQRNRLRNSLVQWAAIGRRMRDHIVARVFADSLLPQLLSPACPKTTSPSEPPKNSSASPE